MAEPREVTRETFDPVLKDDFLGSRGSVGKKCPEGMMRDPDTGECRKQERGDLIRKVVA